MSGIFFEDESKVLNPINIYQGVPYFSAAVYPDFYGSYYNLVFPNQDCICTYGYNLCVSDYRGRWPDDLSATPYDRGAFLNGTHNRGGTSVASGLDVCSFDNYVCAFIPTSTSVDSRRQKIRGYYYGDYDSITHVNDVTRFTKTSNRDAFTAGSTPYTITMGIRSGVKKMTVSRAWIIFRSSSKTTELSYEIAVPWCTTVSDTSSSLYLDKNTNSRLVELDGSGIWDMSSGNTLGRQYVLNVNDERYNIIVANYENAVNVSSGATHIHFCGPILRVHDYSGAWLPSTLDIDVFQYGLELKAFQD